MLSPVSVMNRFTAHRTFSDRVSFIGKKSLFGKLSTTPRITGSLSVLCSTYRKQIGSELSRSFASLNEATPFSLLRSSCRKQVGSALSRSFTSLNEATPFSLCFLRHGQSTWNRDNRFIGWTDTPLTDQGVLEARVAGQMLRNSNIQFDEVHTSLLRRCIRTTNIVLMELAQEYLPIYKSWRLNERNYGDLVVRRALACRGTP
jgi:Histidine phosphatase superfamily (branch 1)